jgi:hypothetical protein
LRPAAARMPNTRRRGSDIGLHAAVSTVLGECFSTRLLQSATPLRQRRRVPRECSGALRAPRREPRAPCKSGKLHQDCKVPLVMLAGSQPRMASCRLGHAFRMQSVQGFPTSHRCTVGRCFPLSPRHGRPGEDSPRRTLKPSLMRRACIRRTPSAECSGSRLMEVDARDHCDGGTQASALPRHSGIHTEQRYCTCVPPRPPPPPSAVARAVIEGLCSSHDRSTGFLLANGVLWKCYTLVTYMPMPATRFVTFHMHWLNRFKGRCAYSTTNVLACVFRGAQRHPRRIRQGSARRSRRWCHCSIDALRRGNHPARKAEVLHEIAHCGQACLYHVTSPEAHSINRGYRGPRRLPCLPQTKSARSLSPRTTETWLCCYGCIWVCLVRQEGFRFTDNGPRLTCKSTA